MRGQSPSPPTSPTYRVGEKLLASDLLIIDFSCKTQWGLNKGYWVGQFQPLGTCFFPGEWKEQWGWVRWRDSFNMHVLQGEANHFISSVFPHTTGTGTWSVEGLRSVNQSPALSSVLPERSRADIMESDSLLASLSADGEIQAVTWWLACQQEACRS